MWTIIRHNIILLVFQLFVLISFCVVCYIIAEKVSDKQSVAQASLNFYKETKTIPIIIKRKDVKTFLRVCSKRGVFVIERYWVFWEDGITMDINRLNWELFSDSNLEKTINWIEKTAEFSYKEIVSKPFVDILEKFSDFIDASSAFGGPYWDLNMEIYDFLLGPAIGGKVASNAYWYIRFVREDGKWRVRSLEFITH